MYHYQLPAKALFEGFANIQLRSDARLRKTLYRHAATLEVSAEECDYNFSSRNTVSATGVS